MEFSRQEYWSGLPFPSLGDLSDPESPALQADSLLSEPPCNIGVCISFQISVYIFLGIYPGVELLDHMVDLFLVFSGTSIMFSTVPAPVYIPTNSVGELPSHV